MNVQAAIVKDALDQYFESGDFNGFPVFGIAKKYGRAIA